MWTHCHYHQWTFGSHSILDCKWGNTDLQIVFFSPSFCFLLDLTRLLEEWRKGKGGAGPRLMCEWRYGTVWMPRPLYFQTDTATHPHQLMFPSQLTDVMRIRSLCWPVHEWTSLTLLYVYNSLRNDNHLLFFFSFFHDAIWTYTLKMYFVLKDISEDGQLNTEVGDRIREARSRWQTLFNLVRHVDQGLLISFHQNGPWDR